MIDIKSTKNDKPLLRILENSLGSLNALKQIKQINNQLNNKRLKIGIYDHAFHFVGGGQRYAALIAEYLQKNFEVTIICNKPLKLSNINKWYDINLNKCNLKILPIKEFAESKFIYPQIFQSYSKTVNPFDIISKESLNYDIFINANMMPYVKALSPLSIFICHFPDTERNIFFETDSYDYFITNSDYGSKWLKKKWHINHNLRLYPGVKMKASSINEKENIILSVARFEEGGSKKQIEMINAFTKIIRKHKSLNKWKLVLVGGSSTNNPYLKKVKKASKKCCIKIEVKENINTKEVKSLYSQAKIFWHLCGLNESRPHLIEHFGMTTVEAMQNKCVPISINAGGQKEIIKDQFNGYLIKSTNQLIKKTIKLMSDKNKLDLMAKNTHTVCKFSESNFTTNLENFFKKILSK